jgi:hypothetical protein
MPLMVVGGPALRLSADQAQKHSLIRAPLISAVTFSKGGGHVRYFGKQDSAFKVKEPK